MQYLEKHAKFRELTIRRVKVEIGDAFRIDTFVTIIRNLLIGNKNSEKISLL